MKKKVCILGFLISICLSLSANTVEENVRTIFNSLADKITSVSYAQNFGFEFAKPSTNVIYSGSLKMDFQDYWFDLNIGLVNQFQYGVLYGRTVIDKETGDASSSSLFNSGFTQELYYGIGLAYNLPLKDSVSLNFEVGPRIAFTISASKNEITTGNFLFGIWGSAAARFFTNKTNNLICGVDIAYNFVDSPIGVKNDSGSAMCNYLTLRPFVGYCFATESLVKRRNKRIE